MDLTLLGKAFVMGIVEGLTEFLPISSTGHLIIVGDALDFNNDVGKLFEIVIQLGAILAVCWEYRSRIGAVASGVAGGDRTAVRFTLNLFIAFLPAAVLGLLFIKAIKAHFFQPFTVAIAFIAGGIVIFLVERFHPAPRIHTVDQMRWPDALKVGIAQAFSLIPGTSRSGATIMGGMLFGLSRTAATEFSFFLAIPTMFAATFYELSKHWSELDAQYAWVFVVGFFMAFASAFVAVKGLLRFIAHHSFNVFAVYRILFGLLLLAYYRQVLFQGWS